MTDNLIPSRYQEFLEFVFDRPESESDADAWYWTCLDGSEDFQASNDELAILYAYLFNHCGKDLAPYSNNQVGNGLNYLLSNIFSPVFKVKDSASESLKHEVIKSLGTLYRDCFNVRCSPKALEQNELQSSLDYICLMLWELTPLSYVEPANYSSIQDYRRYVMAMMDVIQSALELSNPVCTHSAIYGIRDVLLCCVEQTQVDRIRRILEEFMKKAAQMDKSLSEFIRAAFCDSEGKITIEFVK